MVLDLEKKSRPAHIAEEILHLSRRFSVLAVADNFDEVKQAKELGVDGIFCRTEGMFFGPEPERLSLILSSLMIENSEERRPHLEKLLALQRRDFEEIFHAADGLPVTIRLLDRSVYLLLPDSAGLTEEVIRLRCGPESDEELTEKEMILAFVRERHEFNPMIGQRGSARIDMGFPGLVEMQRKAVFEAACQVAREGIEVQSRIAVPFVSDSRELWYERDKIRAVALKVMDEQEVKVNYQIGAVIATPRACLVADEIARRSDFAFIDTDTLTELSYGIDKENAGRKIVDLYIERGIYKDNPLVVLDQGGTSWFIEESVRRTRAVKSEMEIGVFGEHTQDPDAIIFFDRVGIDILAISSFLAT